METRLYPNLTEEQAKIELDALHLRFIEQSETLSECKGELGELKEKNEKLTEAVLLLIKQLSETRGLT